jgi:hypothetical protein
MTPPSNIVKRTLTETRVSFNALEVIFGELSVTSRYLWGQPIRPEERGGVRLRHITLGRSANAVVTFIRLGCIPCMNRDV